MDNSLCAFYLIQATCGENIILYIYIYYRLCFEICFGFNIGNIYNSNKWILKGHIYVFQ